MWVSETYENRDQWPQWPGGWRTAPTPKGDVEFWAKLVRVSQHVYIYNIYIHTHLKRYNDSDMTKCDIS